eukprot:6487908-Amphidinium_carterae.1
MECGACSDVSCWLSRGINELSDNEQGDIESARESSHLQYQKRFECQSQLCALVDSHSLGRVVGFTEEGKAAEVWPSTNETVPALVRGRAFLKNSMNVEEQFLMCALATSEGPEGQVCRVKIHAPTDGFEEKTPQANSCAWRTQLGFDPGGKPQTTTQFWLALGRKQRAARFGGVGVLTLWIVSEDATKSIVHELWKTWQNSDVL